MARREAWAIKTKREYFVNYPPREYWEADRTMLFRTRRQAQAWLKENQFWALKGEVVKVIVTVKEYGT
jgi:hypothetical protein